MGLKEKAIEAYEKEKERVHKEKNDGAEKFAVQAKEILRERIGDEFAIQVISKEPYETIFGVDGIKFRVNTDRVYIIKKCDKCETEYYTELISGFGDKNKSFQNIGEILSEPHNDYDCKRIIEEKEENKEPTIEEKLVEILRSFIRENSSEWI